MMAFWLWMLADQPALPPPPPPEPKPRAEVVCKSKGEFMHMGLLEMPPTDPSQAAIDTPDRTSSMLVVHRLRSLGAEIYHLLPVTRTSDASPTTLPPVSRVLVETPELPLAPLTQGVEIISPP